SATGLPPGVSIANVTDRIWLVGSPAPGDAEDSPYHVTLTATDGIYSGQATFTWNITATVPISNSVQFDQATGTLTVAGGTANDKIVIAPTTNGKNVQVTLNGKVVSSNIALAAINQINVRGQDGNDAITIANIAKPINVDGGAGTNSLTVNGKAT